MEKEISNLFNEVIELWRNAEEAVINDRGTIEDYDLLEEEEINLRKKLDSIIIKYKQ